MTIYAVRYVYDSRTEVRDRVRPEHRRYLGELLESGTLLASGPFTGPTEGGPDEPDGALLMVRGESAAEVVATLDDDPFAVAGVVAQRTLRPWNPVIGPWA